MPNERYTVEIDHLQEEAIEAGSPREAAQAVTTILRSRDTLLTLPDDEPVQIKRPDRRPWGRHLTIGDFRHGDVAAEDDAGDGPVRDASIASYQGIAPSTEG